MKVIYIECNAEEMRANRTIIDNLAEMFGTITRAIGGIDVTPEMMASAMSQDEDSEEESEE